MFSYDLKRLEAIANVAFHEDSQKRKAAFFEGVQNFTSGNLHLLARGGDQFGVRYGRYRVTRYCCFGDSTMEYTSEHDVDSLPFAYGLFTEHVKCTVRSSSKF